ncbi:bifunctional metallophosphatase/5'-nucleotidase [Priestia megaterium]|nr:bifunctional metallophosphatase/5'-nucleotidase [Priestia megaterium]
MSLLQRISTMCVLLLLILGTYHHVLSSRSSSSSNHFIQVQLLGMNDLHGQLDKYQNVLGFKAGGAEYLAAYIKKYKQENDHTLVVHAGDMVGGSPPISSLFQDEPTIEFLNLLNVDIGTPGNHEFDRGVTEMKRLIQGGFHEKTGSFKGSHTTYTSANIIDRQTGNFIFPPYAIKRINGIDIGFIGVVTTETNDFVLPENRKEVKVTDEVKAINQAVAILKEKGIKSIVILAHVSAESNLKGLNPEEELVKMAPQIDDEVDIIFGGHSHKYANAVVDDKLIVQSYSYGKAFSQVNLSIDPETQEIVKKKAKIIPTFHHQIKPDQETITFLNKYKDKMGSYANDVIGEVPHAITRKKNEEGESPLAQMVAETIREQMNTEIAFVHHGGIRASLNKGNVTMEDLYTAFPFEHRVVKLQLTGKQIKDALEQQWIEDRENRLQMAGVTVVYNVEAPVGSRILSVKDQNGNELESSKEYTVSVSDYLAAGGDGFTAFQKGEIIKNGPSVVNAVAGYLQEKHPSQVVKQ